MFQYLGSVNFFTLDLNLTIDSFFFNFVVKILFNSSELLIPIIMWSICFKVFIYPRQPVTGS